MNMYIQVYIRIIASLFLCILVLCSGRHCWRRLLARGVPGAGPSIGAASGNSAMDAHCHKGQSWIYQYQNPSSDNLKISVVAPKRYLKGDPIRICSGILTFRDQLILQVP